MTRKLANCADAIRGILVFVAVWMLLPAAVQAGPIFFPGKLEDGKFVPDKSVEQPCYSVRYSTITAAVDDGFAATKIQETIAGPEKAVQAVCIIPLPEGTYDQDVVVAAGIPNRDHAILPAVRFLDPDAAQKLYETLAHGLGSVEVLSLTGKPAMLIPRFELQGRVEIVVQFKQKVHGRSGVWSLECPVPATQWAGGSVARLSVAVTVGSTNGKPLRAMFSPTHNTSIERRGLYEAVVRVKTDNWSGNEDFRLCWVADKDDLGLRVLAHRAEGDQEGYFMLVGNPTGSTGRQSVIDKDVIFVLDTSGSMRGEKIEQARAAIDYCLERLNPGDRFNIVTFGTEVTSFGDAAVLRSEETLSEARAFVEGVVAKGRTNISGALEKALSGKPQQGRPRITIFLTDGTPTAGELVPEKILEGVREVTPAATRIFVMGVGNDVNAHLLDKLAELTDGSSEYVTPQEEIDAKMAALYDRLSYPVLTGVVVDCGELRTHSVYPKRLPALFKGSEIMIFGRYRDGGKHTFTVSGTLSGQPAGYTCVAELPRETGGEANEFVAPLWAARKIGYLLQEIRLHGENEELIAEVVRLSKKFGIVTEYTEFIAWAYTNVSTDLANNEARRRMSIANTLKAGQWAVNQSRNDRQLQMRVVANQGANNYLDPRGNLVGNGLIRQFGRNVFYLCDGQWVDAEDPGERKTRVVKILSKEYFDLLRDNRKFAEVQQLGWAISLNLGDERIVVENGGKLKSEKLQRQWVEENFRQRELDHFERMERQFEPQLQQIPENRLRNQLIDRELQINQRNVDRLRDLNQAPNDR